MDTKPQCSGTESVDTQTEDATSVDFHNPCFISINISDIDKQCQINHALRTVVDVAVGKNKGNFYFFGYESLIKQNRFENFTGVDKGIFDYFLQCLRRQKYMIRVLR